MRFVAANRYLHVFGRMHTQSAKIALIPLIRPEDLRA